MENFIAKLGGDILSEAGIIGLIVVILLGFIGIGMRGLLGFLKWQAQEHATQRKEMQTDHAKERELMRQTLERNAEAHTKVQGEINATLREFSAAVNSAVHVMHRDK